MNRVPGHDLDGEPRASRPHEAAPEPRASVRVGPDAADAPGDAAAPDGQVA